MNHLQSSSEAFSSTRKRVILAYGDSLTAGTTSTSVSLSPYAPYLQDMLLGTEVRHVGLPGWTTAQMVAYLPDGRIGLPTNAQNASLVILLAGTNDLSDTPVDQIFQNLIRLHEACYQVGVSRTIAIGIPPSFFQHAVVAAATNAAAVNTKLQEWSESSSRCTFVPFPFGFERNGPNWDPDGLHLSPRGYQVLGESLAEHVHRILNELNAAESST